MKMPLDCLRFRLQPGEADQEIVGVADIPEPPGVPGAAVPAVALPLANALLCAACLLYIGV